MVSEPLPPLTIDTEETDPPEIAMFALGAVVNALPLTLVNGMFV